MELIQAAVAPINSVQWSTLIAELKPDFQTAFGHISILFTYRLEKEIHVDRVNILLINLNETILRIRGVVDRHLAEATVLWEQSSSYLKEDISYVVNTWDSLRNHKITASFQEDALRKVTQDLTSDLKELDFHTGLRDSKISKGALNTAAIGNFSWWSACEWRRMGLVNSQKVVDPDFDQASKQELMRSSQESLNTMRDRLDRLFFERKKVQEDLEKTTSEIVSLEEQWNKLWKDRALFRASIWERLKDLRDISPAVNLMDAHSNDVCRCCLWDVEHGNVNRVKDLSNTIRGLWEILLRPCFRRWYVLMVDHHVLEEINQTFMCLKDIL